MCPWSFLSVFLLIIMVFVSHVDETWTFNAGETRRVSANRFFDSRIQIQSQVANGIEVYDLHGACPPLSGPTVPLDESWTVKLAPGDYQFDYFFLNQGSSLNMTYHQGKGATNISIFRGKQALRSLQNNVDDDDTLASPVLKRYAGASQTATISFTPSKSDVYVLVYDNASTSAGSATVSYHIDLTTFDLSKQTPSPDCSLTCTVDLHFGGGDCILLKAPSGIVTVHITAVRKWWLIVVIAILPLAIAISRQAHRNAFPHDSLRPPSTNPEATLQPTSPDENVIHADTVDYESIPIIPAENVYPVAVPVDVK